MTTLKRAGASVRAMETERKIKALRFMLITIICVGLWAVISLYARSLGISDGVLLLAMPFCLLAIRLADKHTDKLIALKDRADRGAKAEEVVGELLAELGNDYCVLHDIECKFGNIDHMVISKTGACFLIETKAHGGRVKIADGRILVNGHEPEKNFTGQTFTNMYWLRDQLHQMTGEKVWIQPLIVFTNAFVERAAPLKGVRVINKKYLLSTIQYEAKKRRSSIIWDKRDAISAAFSSTTPVFDAFARQARQQ
ncbi:MAG: NERD domain-containing protein [Anaerolineae bacterium]|nr:NERD domain-containing protein [Anaerolineae bacterium]